MPTFNNGTFDPTVLAPFFIISGIISLALIVLAVVIYWNIFSKAGYSGVMGLLMFVPVVNIVMLCILAFGEWPIYKELNYLRQQVAQRQQYQPAPQQFPSSPQFPHDQPQPPQRP